MLPSSPRMLRWSCKGPTVKIENKDRMQKESTPFIKEYFDKAFDCNKDRMVKELVW